MTYVVIVILLCLAGLQAASDPQTLDFKSSADGFVGLADPPYVWTPDFPDVIRVRSPISTDSYPEYYFYGFVGWDFPENRTGWQVLDATLTLSFNGSIDGSLTLIASGYPMTLGLCASTATWNAYTINWNNTAKFWSNWEEVASEIIPPEVEGRMTYNVTQSLKAWLPANPSPARLTFVLQASTSDETQFASSRSSLFPGPKLTITYTESLSAVPSVAPSIVTPSVAPSVDNVNQPFSNSTTPTGVDPLAVGLGVSLSVAGAAAIFIGVFFGVKKQKKKNKGSDDDELTNTNSGETIYTSVPLHGSPSGSPNVSNAKAVNILASQIKLDKEIGSGNYGKVYIAKFNNAKVAIKYYHQIEALQDFQHEADLFCKMKPHPNIVQLIGICTDGTQPGIVLEYCNEGSLDKHLLNNPNLTFEERVKLMYGTACGVYHLHINDIVHRDLAARNILLNRGQPKISDFGMSRFVTSNEKMGQTKTNIGPVKWMAPESIASQVYSPKSDVWMFANVCYEILTGKSPFEGADIFTVAINIRDNAAHETLPEGTDPQLVEILEKCWSKNPQDRPSMETIIEEFERDFDFLGDSTESN